MSGLEGLLTGQTLVKRYRIQEVIGRGGFAAVYRADDERLGRPVAVKVITIATPDADAAERHRERFEREARAAASLPQHPNVVTVHDFGVDPILGLDFLVMEFLHGEDLAARLRRQGPPPLETAVGILRDAAAGIAVGHRAGIVHRDVKPGNIFLAEREGTAGVRVCILDFGIARVVADDQTLTGVPGEGTPLSPAYASPEQTRGESALTAASDVFSLGVVAFQLLTGEKPFPGSKRLDPAEWVPRRTLRELNPEVPEWLESVVLRAMAYAPQDRFADAEDLAAALADHRRETDAARLAGPIPPRPPEPTSSEVDQTLFQAEPEAGPVAYTPRERQRLVFTERPARRRSPARVLIAVLLLLAVGAAGWWYLAGTDAAGPAASADPSAVEDLETVSDGLEQPEDDTPQSRPATGRDDPAPAPTTPQDPSLPPIGVVPFDTLPTEAPRDSAPLDSATLPPTEVEEDTASAPPDTGPPPPRVIGVPVDSLPPPT